MDGSRLAADREGPDMLKVEAVPPTLGATVRVDIGQVSAPREARRIGPDLVSRPSGRSEPDRDDADWLSPAAVGSDVFRPTG